MPETPETVDPPKDDTAIAAKTAQSGAASLLPLAPLFFQHLLVFDIMIFFHVLSSLESIILFSSLSLTDIIAARRLSLCPLLSFPHLSLTSSLSLFFSPFFSILFYLMLFY